MNIFLLAQSTAIVLRLGGEQRAGWIGRLLRMIPERAEVAEISTVLGSVSEDVLALVLGVELRGPDVPHRAALLLAKSDDPDLSPIALLRKSLLAAETCSGEAQDDRDDDQLKLQFEASIFEEYRDSPGVPVKDSRSCCVGSDLGQELLQQSSLSSPLPPSLSPEAMSDIFAGVKRK